MTQHEHEPSAVPSSVPHRGKSAVCVRPGRSRSALVLFPGGQDGTTCLVRALGHFARVETVSFAYGQRHAVELEVRPRVLDALRAKLPVRQSTSGKLTCSIQPC